VQTGALKASKVAPVAVTRAASPNMVMEEAALPIISSIGMAVAASAGDFGGYTIPIIGLGLLTATIALLAGPVED